MPSQEINKALLDEPTEAMIEAVAKTALGFGVVLHKRVVKALVEAVLRSSTPQEPAPFKQEWRCINCKLVVESLIEPRRCDECGRAHFASIVTLGAQEPVVDDDAEWLDSWLDRRLYSLTDDEQRRLRRIANRLQAKAPETGEE